MDYAQISTDDDQEFVQGSIILLAGLINAAILQKGACLIALSGGSTPKPVYEELGKSEDIDWSKVWISLADERYVPADHADSNTRLVRETLLKHADIPEQNCLFPDTSLPLEQCVEQYGKALENVAPDLAILGMGNDGHIASLFPPVPEAAFDRNVFAVHTQTEAFAGKDRISMTAPVLSRADSKVFLLRGQEKKATWEDMMNSAEDKTRWPAKAILSSGGVTVVNQW